MSDQATSSTEAMVAGASTALLAVLRARRPDLAWEVSQIDSDELSTRTSSTRTILTMLGTEDRDPISPSTSSDPDRANGA